MGIHQTFTSTNQDLTLNFHEHFDSFINVPYLDTEPLSHNRRTLGHLIEK